ncbi:TetR/AcrR family transcriptional regulator [Microlunatus sp. Gsoil 973]|uniref:TetR/AcrR family transcriptional regulator n=1 Tax=Microlunatus sp. Gsoil 973 TaxID=2672569 RepID=UPI0012B4C255|nr:helix-turn-helix domain-containing protein [Microlunatus sp. Gsoil 973]QGN34174.1 TetR family transcriptional regulator [Microlunatus sp. Gsoil 973]
MSGDSLAAALWATPRPGRRGPKPRVDREQIIAAAIRVADQEGLHAASMQRIAGEVGVTKMALYRHVPARGELIALMIEVAMGQPPDTAGPWREGLRIWANAMRQGFAAHPWLSAAASGIRLIGPVELSWFEAGLAALAALLLSGSERLDTLALLSSHVRGIVQQQEDQQDPEQAISARLAAVLADRHAEFPLSTAAFAETSAADAADQAYDYGLERILDGVDALISRR